MSHIFSSYSTLFRTSSLRRDSRERINLWSIWKAHITCVSREIPIHNSVPTPLTYASSALPGKFGTRLPRIRVRRSFIHAQRPPTGRESLQASTRESSHRGPQELRVSLQGYPQIRKASEMAARGRSLVVISLACWAPERYLDLPSDSSGLSSGIELLST